MVGAASSGANRHGRLGLAALIASIFAGVAGAQAQDTAGSSSAGSVDALRAAAQNPVANMISVPFQNNTNFDYGPYGGTQDVLNFQPVIPFELNDDWNLITRWVTPIIWQPQLTPDGGREFGLGNATPSFFFSPNSKSTRFIWGVGPILWLPTATDPATPITKGVRRTSWQRKALLARKRCPMWRMWRWMSCVSGA